MIEWRMCVCVNLWVGVWFSSISQAHRRLISFYRAKTRMRRRRFIVFRVYSEIGVEYTLCVLCVVWVCVCVYMFVLSFLGWKGWFWCSTATTLCGKNIRARNPGQQKQQICTHTFPEWIQEMVKLQTIFGYLFSVVACLLSG